MLQDITTVLPAPGQAVEVLDLEADPKINQLMIRFQQSVQRNPVWFQSHVKNHGRPGETLPYDPRMGISRAEYEELSAGMRDGKGLRLLKLRDSKAAVTKSASGFTRVKVFGLSTMAKGVGFDVAKGEVQLSGLKLDNPSEFANTRGGPVPPNAGLAWKSKPTNPPSRLVQVTVSKIDGTGKCLMTTDVQDLRGAKKARTSEYIRYACP
jgi:hypothetical protein